jgi:hypothetical protein
MNRSKLFLLMYSGFLLSPDGDAGGMPAVESFLDDDLSKVDTSLPLLKEGTYAFEVAKIEKKQNKAGTGELIAMTLKLADEGKIDVNGNPVNKGFPIFHQMSITPTDKYSKDDIKRTVAAFVQAAECERIFPLDQYAGKMVYAKITVQKESPNKDTGQLYPPKNAVGRFIKPGDIKGT